MSKVRGRAAGVRVAKGPEVGPAVGRGDPVVCRRRQSARERITEPHHHQREGLCLRPFGSPDPLDPLVRGGKRARGRASCGSWGPRRLSRLVAGGRAPESASHSTTTTTRERRPLLEALWIP